MAREQLARRREEIRQAHRAGGSGLQVANALATSVDSVLLGLVRTAATELGSTVAAEFPERMALVAVGGYGRLELAPASDVDLLFLYHPSARELAVQLCEQVVRDCWDAGLSLGSSLRTVKDSVSLAATDLSVHTAILEARLLIGSRPLVAQLTEQITRLTRGTRCNPFIDAVVAERTQEQEKFGSAVHMLEPDVKKSKGGLRELHMIRWIARARYGIAGLDDLGREALAAHDVTTLRNAHEFLLRVRNELHFHSRKAQDGFTLNDQVRLAEVFGFEDRPGMLGVERFMQQYYRHGDALAEVAERFVAASRRSAPLNRLFGPFRSRTRRISDEYLIFEGQLAPTPGYLSTLLGSLERIVRFFAVAQERAVPIEPRAADQIRVTLASLEGQDPAPALAEFLQMLGKPGQLAAVLPVMHGLGVLELLIPEFAHARGLIQFNQYHKYAVDEHTLRCVANAEKLKDDTGPLGHAYWEIKHKAILHLALLLHDLGKGFDIDHSELGRTIALREASRYGLSPHLSEVLVFLVHQHLLMSNLAFRRDLSDEHVISDFVSKVGTPEVLKMLYVLTAVDIQSVGPGVWTSWKGDVLHELYARALEMLTGDVDVPDAERRAAEIRREVTALMARSFPTAAFAAHLDAMPRQELLASSVEEIAEHLRAIHSLGPDDVLTTTAYDPLTRICRYTVYASESLTTGPFYKVSGVLAAKGLNILSARITTRGDGIVVDRFEVLDEDNPGPPPAARQVEVAGAIRAVLLGERTVESLFARRYRLQPTTEPPPVSHQPSTRVEIDNDTSLHDTVIEVFALDRQGLLYVIARTIFELGLAVSLAKIATSVDQVLDVFYVTDENNAKITDDARLGAIREVLTAAIDKFETVGDGQFSR
jgi:[protein-PII] uridylyltransferase